MNVRGWVVLAGLMAVVPACMGSGITAPECVPLSSQQEGMEGDTVVTTTGLRYIVNEAGDPEADALAGCGRAIIHYRLYLGEDLIQDSRDANPNGRLHDFGFGFAVAGFEEGLYGMRPGEHRRLIVPPQLGYRDAPVRDQQTGEIIIPANSTLEFDLVLLDFVN